MVSFDGIIGAWSIFLKIDGGGEIARVSDAGEVRCHDLFSGLMKGFSMIFFCDEEGLGMGLTEPKLAQQGKVPKTELQVCIIPTRPGGKA